MDIVILISSCCGEHGLFVMIDFLIETSATLFEWVFYTIIKGFPNSKPFVILSLYVFFMTTHIIDNDHDNMLTYYFFLVC